MWVFVKNLCVLNLLSLALNAWAVPDAKPLDPSQYSSFTNVIFKIFYPSGHLTSLVDTEQTPFSESGIIGRDLQLSVCYQYKIKKCPLLPFMKSGTAFMVSNSFTLATALRNIHQWLHYVKKYNPDIDIKKISLPTYLLNNEGKTLLHTGIANAEIKISMINDAPGLFDKPYYEFTTKTDRLVVALSEYVELTTNVALAERGIGIGPMVNNGQHAVIGFPRGKLESATGSLEEKFASLDLLTLTNIPAQPGYIGSPLYDTKGNVVAMMIASNCTDRYINCRTLFLHLNISRLRTVWDVLARAPQPKCKNCSRFSAGALKNALTTKERLPLIQ